MAARSGLPDTHKSSILIAVVFFALVAGFVAFRVVARPSCGDLAEHQMASAARDLADRVPGLEVYGFGSECSSADDTTASWGHPDLLRFMADAEAAGCVVDATAVRRVGRPLAECRNLSRVLVFYLDDPWRTGPAEGSVDLE